MDFSLPEELVMLKRMVRKFTENEIMPLEMTVIEREANRGMRAEPSLRRKMKRGSSPKQKNLVYGA
jgi:hypothetical protein